MVKLKLLFRIVTFEEACTVQWQTKQNDEVE